MADLVADKSARAAVLAFLNQEGVQYSSSDSEADLEQLKPRPTRLGLGAKFIPHESQAASEADRRLAGALRKQSHLQSEEAVQRKREDGAERSDASSEDKDSRVRLMSKGKRKKKRKKPPTAESLAETRKENGLVVQDKTVQNDTLHEQVVENEKRHSGCRPRAGANGLNSTSGTGEESNTNDNQAFRKNNLNRRWNTMGPTRPGSERQSFVPRKRKKIRSRQKNLRRDNRPKDKLPPHLTEETLLGGRMRRMDDGWDN